ncbi:DUF4974 domain-containing protein [Bacteroides sp. f07]|uniref:FecR family protein n=1 Tax=Bacteroides sp. f07 TaxID=3132704 RepID=UPI0034BB3AFC
MNNRHLIHIAALIRKSISGEITLEEKKLLEDWLDESARHRELFDKYNNPDFLSSIDLEKDMVESQEAYSNFMQRLKPVKPVRRIVWNKYVAAAVLIAFVCASAIFVYMYDGGKPHSPSELAVVDVLQTDTVPADSTDILLITASGEKIPVQSSQKMLSVLYGSIKIGEQSIGEEAQAKAAPTEVVYNTLKILRGKRFKMQLSDGTLVWLNADSEITFPSSFDGKERKVMAKGELFFDVAENKSHPFIVETPIGKIRVLGTAFNVHCYKDEMPMTTLVRGKIAYSLGKDSVILAPGQQCRVKDNKLSVREVDTYEYVSWIDEVLVFKDKELNEILSTLSRLYDVDIYYENPDLKRLPFTGSFKQYEHLDKIIRMIEECGLIHIKQDGKTLTISK